MRRVGLLATALVALFVAHHFAQRADAARSAIADREELMVLPDGRFLRALSLGHPRLLADLVWLRAIQYYGEQRLTSRNYDQTARYFTAIYDLDPRFMSATRFGALILSQDAGDPESALALLERAERDHPRTWQYPFDRGFIEQTIRRNYEAAGLAYRRAASLPGSPPLAEQLAGVSFARLGDREAAREVWWELLQADNAMTRAVAERNLKNLDLEECEELLTTAVRAFQRDRGTIPANWDELLRTGYLVRLPEDPWSGRFFWVPENDEVLSSTTIDRRMAAFRDLLQGAVESYREREGHLPSSLDDVIDTGTSPSLWTPFGLGLDYDAASGDLAWNPPWPATEPRNQGKGAGA